MKNNEFITKNDFLFFQNEMLGDLKKVEIKINEKLSQLSTYLETQKSINEEKNQQFSSLIENLTKKIEEKTDLQKFENKLKQSINTMHDTTVKLEVKYNIINRDLRDSCFKYDKIISNNLLVPRIVGPGCHYENLKYFIEYTNTKIGDLLKTKDKQNLDSKLFKEKMENLIKQNEIQLETMENKMTDIIKQQIQTCNNIFLDKISEVNSKIEIEKTENQKYLEEQKNILDKIVNDFNKFYKDEYNDLFNNFNLNVDKNKDELHHINNKLKEIEEIIKKFSFHRRKSSMIIIKDNTGQNNIITNITNNNNYNGDLRRQKSIISTKFENSNEKNYIKNNISSLKNNTLKDIDNKDTEKDNSKNKVKHENKRKEPDNKLKNTNSNLTLNKSIMVNIKEKDSFEDRNNSDNNNKIKAKKDLKNFDFKLNNRKLSNGKDNENNKVNDNINYESNNKRHENNTNKNFYFKLINYNDMLNERNSLNNNKKQKNVRIGHNLSSSNMGYKTKYKNFYNFADNIKVNTVAIGSEFSEKDLQFIKVAKYNLSQAYILAKARLEDQQRLKLNMFSTLSVKGNNSGKLLGNNKYKFPPNYYKFKKNKIKEKEKLVDKNSNNYNSSLYDNPEIPNPNFPSINNDLMKRNNSSLDMKNMYLSYVNDSNGEKMPFFNKDANVTQIDIMNKNIFKIYKRNSRHKIIGSSSNYNHPIKMGAFTPHNISNPYLNCSNNFDRSYDFSYEERNAKETLKHVKSYLIKKFKEDYD